MGRRRLPTEPFAIDILAQGGDGAGRGEHAGRTLRVHDALPGERVSARYLLGRRFRGQAETLAVLEPSPERVEPRCPHFGVCGACSLQHQSGSGQRAFKQDRLWELLKAAGVSPGEALAPLHGESWAYRRKARLSARHVAAKGRVLVGFRERDGRFVTDMRECHVLHPLIADRLGALGCLLDALEAGASVPQIEVSCGDTQAAMVLRHLVTLEEPDLGRLAGFQRETGLQVFLQAGGPETVRPLNDATALTLRYALPGQGVHFDFEPLDFVQVNGALNRAMVDQALAQLDLAAGHRVLDLFCGLGNFTLPIAGRVREVVGLEGSPALVERARANARCAGRDNAVFKAVDLYAETLSEHWPRGGFDRVLLDPPRSGAAPVLPRVADSGAARVVYVSCNPATLATDAALMQGELGYRLVAAGIMDMFPQTSHIEAMAVFERD